jgi:NAD-dependent SIR2 family protein deacetylase
MDAIEVLRRLGGRRLARCAGCRKVADSRDLQVSVWLEHGRVALCEACREKAMLRQLARIRSDAEARVAQIQVNADDRRSLLRPSNRQYREAVAAHERDMAEAMSWWKMGG